MAVSDLIPDFRPDVKQEDPSDCIRVVMEDKKKRTGRYLSDDSYLSLYRFAIALNGRYAGAKTEEEMQKAFENRLSLEYKLSNIAQAKAFDRQLNGIRCFYTDRAVDYEPVRDFRALTAKKGHEKDLLKISVAEHKRWCDEKREMGWQYGKAHLINASQAGKAQTDYVMRERTRMHRDLVNFSRLDAEEQFKDQNPMELMCELIRAFGGLTIYTCD